MGHSGFPLKPKLLKSPIKRTPFCDHTLHSFQIVYTTTLSEIMLWLHEISNLVVTLLPTPQAIAFFFIHLVLKSLVEFVRSMISLTPSAILLSPVPLCISSQIYKGKKKWIIMFVQICPPTPTSHSWSLVLLQRVTQKDKLMSLWILVHYLKNALYFTPNSYPFVESTISFLLKHFLKSLIYFYYVFKHTQKWKETVSTICFNNYQDSQACFV